MARLYAPLTIQDILPRLAYCVIAIPEFHFEFDSQGEFRKKSDIFREKSSFSRKMSKISIDFQWNFFEIFPGKSLFSRKITIFSLF